MPARVVVVLDEPGFAERAAEALNSAGYETLAIPDSMSAVKALDQVQRIELLITCPQFPPGKPTGISLARMTRYRRPTLKSLFIGPRELASFTERVGKYIAAPVSLQELVAIAVELLEQPESPPGDGSDLSTNTTDIVPHLQTT